MKNMFGKQRPDFLARCNPDISQLNNHLAGGYTSEALEGTSQIVTWEICRIKMARESGVQSLLMDGEAFPAAIAPVCYAWIST